MVFRCCIKWTPLFFLTVLVFQNSVAQTTTPRPHGHKSKWRFLQKCLDLDDCDWNKNHVCRTPKPEEITSLAAIALRELKANGPGGKAGASPLNAPNKTATNSSLLRTLRKNSSLPGALGRNSSLPGTLNSALAGILGMNSSLLGILAKNSSLTGNSTKNTTRVGRSIGSSSQPGTPTTNSSQTGSSAPVDNSTIPKPRPSTTNGTKAKPRPNSANGTIPKPKPSSKNGTNTKSNKPSSSPLSNNKAKAAAAQRKGQGNRVKGNRTNPRANVTRKTTISPYIAAIMASLNASSNSTTPAPIKNTNKKPDPPLPDDGIIHANEKRCFCLDGTAMDPSVKSNPSCVSKYAYLEDACGDIAVTSPNKPKVCAKEGNLECSDPVPTQFSVCRCTANAEPNIYTRTCVIPPRIIKLGGVCRDNATKDEESCEGDFTICSNGTCVCDIEDGSVLKDSYHEDCYLKVNPRHAKVSSAYRLMPFKLRSSRRVMSTSDLVLDVSILILLCLLVNLFLINMVLNTNQRFNLEQR